MEGFGHGERRAAEFAFTHGESPIAPLAKRKETEKKKPFVARGSGLDEFRIDPQTLADQGLESDDEAAGRLSVVQSKNYGKPENLRISQSDLEQSGIEGHVNAQIRVKDSLSRGNMEDLKITEQDLTQNGIEDHRSAHERATDKSSQGKGLEDFRTEGPASFTESGQQEKNRIQKIEHAGLKAEAESEINALKIDLGRLEGNFAQIGMDIISLQGKIAEQDDDAMKAAHMKVLSQFEREKLKVGEEVASVVERLKKAEDDYNKYFL